MTANGKDKVTVVVSTSMILAALTFSFMLGSHIGNKAIHEDVTVKEARIQNIVDHSVDREIMPLLKRIDARLSRIENHTNGR